MKKALPADRPRGNVTVRMRHQVRDALQGEADRNGRSLSEEIEFRLECSLRDQHAAVVAWQQTREGLDTVLETFY